MTNSFFSHLHITLQAEMNLKFVVIVPNLTSNGRQQSYPSSSSPTHTTIISSFCLHKPNIYYFHLSFFLSRLKMGRPTVTTGSPPIVGDKPWTRWSIKREWLSRSQTYAFNNADGQAHLLQEVLMK